ncbi:TonB-dependent receptor, partial [Streptococcus danieliae]|nr:TonB-dependent receptor [Streptococcus danieliae]
FNGRYNNGQKISRDFVDQYGDLFENEDYLLRVSNSVTADYSASEDTIAAYAMNTLEWEQTTLLFGLRVENTRTSGSAFEFDEYTEEAIPLDASNSYTNFFPSVHLRHELDNGVILRAAYSTGINRPNFENLVPYLTVED